MGSRTSRVNRVGSARGISKWDVFDVSLLMVARSVPSSPFDFEPRAEEIRAFLDAELALWSGDLAGCADMTTQATFCMCSAMVNANPKGMKRPRAEKRSR